jgi:short subunit dehydrogenase-like uncharacterized protein
MHALMYGATGYTGSLIARTALEQGLTLILAGRSREKLAALADETGYGYRVFDVDDTAAVHRGMADVGVLLNCAGPFSRTYRSLTDACLEARAHYLDVTGEIAVFEGVAARDAEARAVGVMLLPGAGFDVVPSDCLARYLSERLPGAVRLLLGVSGSGPLSHGTATTAVENQASGGMIRQGGRLTRVPAAYRTRTIDFGDGRPRTAVTIPWGDVATAYYSTGIPDIEVYAAVPRRLIRLMRASRYIGSLLRMKPVQQIQKRLIRSRPPGPSQEELAEGEGRVWGRVEDAHGNHATAAVRTPNGYRLTALAALHVLRHALQGNAPPGYQTPATAYGADLILEVPGTERFDINGGSPQ